MVAAFVSLDILLLSLWTGIEPMHTGYRQFEEKVTNQISLTHFSLYPRLKQANAALGASTIYQNCPKLRLQLTPAEKRSHRQVFMVFSPISWE